MSQKSSQSVGALFSKGEFKEGLNTADSLMAAGETSADLLSKAAGCAIMLEQLEKAETFLNSAIDLEQNFAPAHFSLAFLFGQTGRFLQAEAAYKKVLELDPTCAEAWANLGTLLTELDRVEEAESCFGKALAIRPTQANIHNDLGVHYLKRKKYDLAARSLSRAIEINPQNTLAITNQGRMLAECGRNEEAEKCYRRALSLNPGFVEAHYHFGVLLAATGRAEQAEAAYRKTIALSPKHQHAYGNLGNLLKDLNRLEESEAFYLKVIECSPGLVDGYSTLGSLCMKLNRFQEAEAYFKKALGLFPTHIKSQLNYAFLLLLQARFDEGWPLYEARYAFDPRTNRPSLSLPDLPFPQWRGQALKGKRLLICNEQGHGDMIQFLRYVEILREKGASHIAVVCKKPLLELFRTARGVSEVFASDDNFKFLEFDFWTYLLSVPMYEATGLTNIPPPKGYLTVSQTHQKKWKTRFSSPGFRVGIVWKGSPEHMDDKERSLPRLETLAPLWSIPGVTFVSLQKGQGADQASRPPPQQPLIDAGVEINDFAEAAAVIQQVDLVICVDTAMAHLAGALDCPVWLLTRFVPDWRWLVGREDSPWYPSMRLFRQPLRNHWSYVVQQVVVELRQASEKYWTSHVIQRPDDAMGHFYVGQFFHAKGKFREAEMSYRRSISLNPNNANALGQLGNLLKDQEHLVEAEQKYREVLSLIPRSFIAYNNIGILCKMQNRYEEAEKYYREALSINPEYADAYNNLGNLYLNTGRHSESEIAYKKALSLDPSAIEVHQNLGHVFKEQKRFDECEVWYRKALALQPDNPKSRFLLGIHFLSKGQFDQGWPLFETPYRYDHRIDKPTLIAPFQPFPQWLGQDLSGKSLLIWFEQGFGDVIQFARYAAVLKKMGASAITFMCKKPLRALFETLPGVDKLLEEGDPVEPHDYWMFVMSAAFYCQTRLDTIPATSPYLSASASDLTKWHRQMPSSRLKIGIVWKGSTEHKRDYQRSLPGFTALASLWKVADVCFVSLQKDGNDDDMTERFKDQPTIGLGNKIETFADSAAIISQLDLVICVDTAVAHLAGALGKPVWVLLQYVADWRWMMDRDDSPWYPTMRLFRQQTDGDWSAVVERVAVELQKFADVALSKNGRPKPK